VGFGAENDWRLKRKNAIDGFVEVLYSNDRFLFYRGDVMDPKKAAEMVDAMKWNFFRTCSVPEKNVFLRGMDSFDVFLRFSTHSPDYEQLFVNIRKIQRSGEHSYEFEGITTDDLSVAGTVTYGNDGYRHARIMWEKPKPKTASA